MQSAEKNTDGSKEIMDGFDDGPSHSTQRSPSSPGCPVTDGLVGASGPLNVPFQKGLKAMSEKNTMGECNKKR